jgi:tripartite-type tricarboxylate transporter receptor subunit TctC
MTGSGSGFIREDKMAFGVLVRGATVAVLAMLPVSATWAQTPAEFYKGKNVDIQIGYSVGGGYDVYARLIARYLGKYIPGNPTVIPRNMEGAASLRLANYIYSAAPKDGTTIGSVSRGAAFDPLLGSEAAKFDASKFNWLGSANDEVSLCVSLTKSGITKFDELTTKELTIGSTGTADDTYQFPAVMNGVLGTKFKMVTGYPGGNDVSLAMERGEVQGRCGWSWSSIKSTKLNWVEDKTISLLVQMSLAKHPDLPNVPLVTDLAKTDEQRQIFKLIFARQVMGRPYMLPPGVPQDRVDALRKAFMDTMKDKEFLAEADKVKLEITPVDGDRIQKLVEEIYKTSPDIIAKAGKLVK